MGRFKERKEIGKLIDKIPKSNNFTFEELEEKAILFDYTEPKKDEENQKSILTFIKTGIDNIKSGGKKIVQLVCSVLDSKNIQKFMAKKKLGSLVRVIMKSGHTVTFEDLEGDTIYNVKADIISEDIKVGQIYQKPAVCIM